MVLFKKRDWFIIALVLLGVTCSQLEVAFMDDGKEQKEPALLPENSSEAE